MAFEQSSDGFAVVCEAWAAAWEPRKRLSVADWADQHRRLSNKGSSEPGPWRTSRVPFIREVMECLSPHHPARRIVFMKSSQVAGTEAGLNWVGFTIHHSPAPMLVVLPTIEVGEKWSKQRLASMLEETPVLSRIIAPARSRDSGNTTMMKEFPGGILIIAGANSAASLRSMPAKYLLCDEVDGFPASADDEGDPVKLAERRTATFPRKKIFLVSTPTIKSLSRINKEWLLSDQRHYYVPCPECGTFQVLKWENLRPTDEHKAQAWYACEAAGCVIEEHHKTDMLAAGEWRPHNPDSDIVGFHIWAAYTPTGLGDSWTQMMQEWARIKGNPEQVKVFVNTYRGECFDDPTEKLDWEVIRSRGEAYPLRHVPAGCLILTAGVDVQGSRLAVQIVGWGINGQVWPGIDWIELPGDPTKDEVWQSLRELLTKPIVNGWGISLKITATVIDTNYLTDYVLRFVRANQHLNIFAGHGSKQQGKQAISSAAQQDRNSKGKAKKHGVRDWVIGADGIKHTVFLWLQEDGKTTHAHERRVHFSAELPESYFVGLCSETYDPHKKLWVRTVRLNEPLDTLVYAIAAARHPKVRLHLMKETDWQRFQSVIEPPTGDLFNQAPAAEQPAPAAAPPAAPTPTSSRARRVRSTGVQ